MLVNQTSPVVEQTMYKTEINNLPDPLNVDFIEYRDNYFGSISGNKKAEPFICIYKKNI